MSFTDFLENKLLDFVWGNVAYVVPTTIYVGLSTTQPADDGTNITEPSGNGYARVGVANNTTNWPVAVGGAKSNGTVIQFSTATGTWGTMAYFFNSTAVTGGDILGSGALSTPKLIDNGDTARFDTGQHGITLD